MRLSTLLKSALPLLLAVFSVTSAKAQLAIEESKFLDNTYVTVNVGAATPIKDLFSDMFPVNPIAGISLGKWFSPTFGAELEGNAWFGSHSNGNPGFGTNKKTGAHNIVRRISGYINGLVNFSNLFGGFTGSPRFFEVGGIVGIGVMQGLRPHQNDEYNIVWSARTGLDFAFNFDKAYRHTVSLRPAIYWNLSSPGMSHGGSAFNINGAQLYLGAAYTYHFKTSNGTHYFKVHNIGDYKNTIDSLEQELAKKPKEVIKEVVKTVEVPAKAQTVAAVSDSYIFFAQNSAALTPEAKAVLDNIEGTVDIVATSSPEGDSNYNQTLSEKRAAAVADYLKAKGVTVNSCKGTGVKGDASARVAIIKVQ